MELNYYWEAVKPNGEIINKGGDLTGCVRFSLKSNNGLPQHDIIGVRMKRRFMRRCIKIPLGGKKPLHKNYTLHCAVCENFRIWVNDDTGALLVTSEDYEVKL